ncbi:thiol:disulfide interchange protein DsbD [Verrucomicrobium sp. GAS474]|uniref:protein-disulfide reductase DsbD family protein n=1 Tax=Verrucomicrobium sp. GAS474 TaxID=1882831 RepID=UPI00087B0A77|nr:thioredoxin family protein [Verrucomicrobium sp. GAS474]SDU09165.1 thiol:disulfide interchange protein DsbD [Verrucomicrobium sp. GAS474]
MHRPGLSLALSLSLFLGLLAPLRADAPPETPHVQASLYLQSWLYELPRPAEGEGVRADLSFHIEKGWHLYWRNPGDAGRAVKVLWHLPDGWTAEPLQWPVPKIYTLGTLTDYGYEGDLVLTAVLRPPALETRKPKLNPAQVSAELVWLVCSPEACLPGHTLLRPSPEPAGTKIYHDDSEVFPKPLPKGEATLREAGAYLQLSLSDADGLPSSGPLRFIPYARGLIANGERQFAVRSAQGIELRVKKAEGADALPETVEGLLLAVDAGRGWEIKARVLPPLPVAPPSSGSGTGFPFAALGLAFLGGLLLNLMPCVLPVLSLKVLALVSMPRREGLRHGLAYTAGVVLSFLALAGLLLALRAAGGRFGWGFQLQSPAFVVLIAALFWAITLNLLGLFEIGEGLAARGGAVLEGRKKSVIAPFLGGLLAVIVATPCTAPFMGTALGVAFSQSAGVALLIFAALGLGLAAPYLALAANPAWLRFVPKSGGWMVWFRRLLALPMAVTVVWLVWVFHRETGGGAVLLLALGAVLCAAALFGKWEGKTMVSRLAVHTAALLLAGAAISAAMVYHGVPKPASAAADSAQGEGDWIPYTNERLEAAREAGKPVFVDFTADWCLPCQVNKQVLDAPEVAARFREKGVVRLIADWTRNDPEVTAALAAAGRPSVPLSLLYGSNPALPPKILPSLLTKRAVLDALDVLDSLK